MQHTHVEYCLRTLAITASCDRLKKYLTLKTESIFVANGFNQHVIHKHNDQQNSLSQWSIALLNDRKLS